MIRLLDTACLTRGTLRLAIFTLFATGLNYPGFAQKQVASPRAIPEPPRAGHVETRDGERIYYEVTGSGEPLVLTHGLGGNHAIWYQQVASLAFDYQVVTWDQRGFGKSTNNGRKAGPDAFASDLAELLDHLEIPEAHLVGQSMGGWTVMGFALAHPERVLTLTLADTIAGVYTPAIEAAFDAFIRATLSGAGGPAHLGNHPALGKDLTEKNLAQAFLYRQISGLGPKAPPGMAAKLRNTAFPHEKLGSLTFPILLIVGEHDPIFPLQAIHEAASILPDSQVVKIPGAGHSPYFEKPEAWNRVLVDFYRRSSRPRR